MFRLIMTFTDGSPESEKALPLAEQIASAQGAELVVVQVVDQPLVPIGRTGTPLAEDEARAYLTALEERLRREGVRVRTRLEHGPIAAALLDCEREEQPDLLVIATHGRTGLARFTMGSVADRMVREGTAPVLVVRRSTTPSTKLESAVVMLDGSGLGEAALAVAESLAGRPLKSVTLFRAVAELEDRAAAQTYLDGASARLAPSGVAVETIVDLGDPRFVAERAGKGRDIVILATHGRGGFDRWRHGSVADYVVRFLDQPVLLVRVNEAR